MSGKQKQFDPVSGTLPGVLSREKRASMSSSMSPEERGSVCGEGM
jgi:hypothetical protein